MKDCIFCKIVAGEIPSYKIYEDDKYYGFLDIKPKTKGDALLVPKKHFRWTYEVPYFDDYWKTAKKLTEKMIDVLGADWANYFTYGAVPHAHIHIMPRYGEIKGTDEDIIPKYITLSDEEMKEIAEKILSATISS